MINLSGISSTVNKQTESAKAQDNNNSSEWKYETVQEGDTIYTYIVIGKNMKVLIGKSTVEEDDKDKKKTDNKDGDAAKANQDNTTDKQKTDRHEKHFSFLTDFRMLGLTAHYQKKARQAMKNMEDSIGLDKANRLTARDKYEQASAQNEK